MRLVWGALLLASFAGRQEMPQIGDLSAPRAVRGRDRVQYVGEAETVRAGKSETLVLHFQVEDGFHINSHQPRGDLLIATELSVLPAAGVRVGTAVYPAGRPYSFAASPGETIDAYTGGFAVQLPVVAEAGGHTLRGTLRYQACDRAACYPVRSLPVEVAFTAK